MTKDEARQLCKTDHLFLANVLGYQFQPDVHTDLFKVLEKKSDKLKRLILWPRGHFKTTAVTVDVVQNILNNPETRILLMQATLKITKAWIREIKSHFNGRNPSSRLLSLFPEFKVVEGDPEGFTVGARKRMELRQRTVTAASPKATGTGSHFDDGYFDDLVNQDNFRNVERQDQLESDFDLYQPLIDPGGHTTVTGTRYSFADLYQRVIRRNKGEWELSIKKAYKEDGSLLFPQRQIPDATRPNGFRLIGVTPELLAQKKKDNPENFSAQYLNEILSGTSQAFPEAMLLGAVKSTQDKEYPANAPSYFFIDLAESERADSDHSVITVGRQDGNGRIWIVDVVGSTWSIASFVTVVLAQCLLHRPARIFVEKQPGATIFAEHLRVMGRDRGINVPIEVVPGGRQKGAKNLRISTLETFFKSQRLFLCAGIKDFDRLLEEFTQFPKGRHDDRPDCIALLANQLAQAHFPKPPAVFQPPWFVQAILNTPNDLSKPRSLCGDGFV
jgi:predicted phage terminase large subunit-like protein